MKRLLMCALVLIIAVGLFAGCSSSDRTEELKVYNWQDYIDPDLIGEFEAHYQEKYGEKIKVIYETFDTNEIMYSKITKGKEDYDVAAPSDYMIEKMFNEGLLLPLDQNIKGVYEENVPSFIRNQFDQITASDQLYSVGYMWGTMGIIYNKAHVSEEQLEKEGWGILWNEDFKGKLFMKDSIRDTYATGNLYVYEKEYVQLKEDFEKGNLSYEEYEKKLTEMFNRTDDETIAKVEEALIWQKENIDAMYDVDNDKNAMVNGTAYLDVAWSGDAIWAIWGAEEAASGVELGYYIPKSGTNIWFDGWVVPKYAKNTKGANEWISFMLDKEVAMRNMDFIGYTSVVGGDDILAYSEELAFDTDVEGDVSYFFEGATNVLINSSMYPDFSVIKSAAVMKDFGTANERITSMWTRIKGNNLPAGLIVVAIVAAVAVIGAGVVIVIKKKGKKTVSKKRKEVDYTPE